MIKKEYTEALGTETLKNFAKVQREELTLDQATHQIVSETNYLLAKKYSWTYKEGSVNGKK
jgi:hypothetical protein